METSHILLNHGLTFLAIATGIMIFLVGGFFVKLLFDLSKLTNNINDTTSIVKAEIEPTLQEFNNALKSINSIAKNADKQVDSLSKLFENILGLSASLFTKARNLSGGLLKGFVKGMFGMMKMFIKTKK